MILVTKSVLANTYQLKKESGWLSETPCWAAPGMFSIHLSSGLVAK